MMYCPTSVDPIWLPYGSGIVEEVNPLSGADGTLFCQSEILMSPSQAMDPRLEFSEAPKSELQSGLLPDAVRPLEAELCQFEASGKRPSRKVTESWGG